MRGIAGYSVALAFSPEPCLLPSCPLWWFSPPTSCTRLLDRTSGTRILLRCKRDLWSHGTERLPKRRTLPQDSTFLLVPGGLLHQRLRSRDCGVLHCSDLFVLSVDVTHEQAQFSFGFLQLPRESIQRCHRSERSRSSVVSLSSATPDSVATQHQRSATIFKRVVVFVLCIKTTRSLGCTTVECRHGCESQVSGLSHVLKCNCLQNDQDQYRRNA